MKTSSHSPLWLLFGLALSLAVFVPSNRGMAAEKIKGTYEFEGKAKARGAGGNSTKKFKGKMRVGIKSVRLQIPISRDGKVGTCKKMIKARLNKKLKRNPTRANRRATLTNASCGNSTWTGSLRLRWIEHPEGYAVSFSMGGVNIDVGTDKVTGKFQGSTGTLSTEENLPEVPEVPEVPVAEEDSHSS